MPVESTSKDDLPRGSPEDWRRLLEVIREGCTAAPATRAGMLLYARRGAGHRREFKSSRLQCNAKILEPLCKGVLSLDAEVSLRFGASKHGNDKRGSRQACLARHWSARREKDNTFTWALPESGRRSRLGIPSAG